MNAKRRNMLIAKYAFLALVALNILLSIWVIIYEVRQVRYAQEEQVDDFFTGKKGEGHYAHYWLIVCIVVVAITDLLSLAVFYAVFRERTQLVMVYSCVMFVIAVYAAYDKYMKNSVSAFLVPLLTGIVGVLYVCLDFLLQYESVGTVPDVNVQYVKNYRPATAAQPTTCVDIPNSYSTQDSREEEQKLNLPDS